MVVSFFFKFSTLLGEMIQFDLRIFFIGWNHHKALDLFHEIFDSGLEEKKSWWFELPFLMAKYYPVE